MNNFKITTSLTIVFLILIRNVAQIGSYAASNAAAFENNNFSNSNNKNINNDETHRLTKRMDLESCLGQFDVHKNTIIRTGESQAIGGKYLQGIELETMEECQRLCCETDLCDVYIFESKKDGYCYLFQCGTPENFHCKFTRHANYTSAVLTPILRPPNEVTTSRPATAQQALAGHSAHGSTTNISQQEWELSNLKVKSDIKEKSNDIMPASNALTNSNNKKSLNSLTNIENTLTTKVNASVQCGRFQFACHNGECIAVYNACDGIPQCEDGSDEGPECSGANNNNNLNSKSTQEFTVSDKVAEPVALPQYPNALSQQTPQQQLQSMQQQPHGQVLSAINGLINNREDPNVWETRKIVSGSANTHFGNENLGNPESSQVVAQQQLQQQQQQQQQSDSFTSYIHNRGQNGNSIYPAGSSTLEQSGLYIPQVAQEELPANVAYIAQQQQHILLPPPPPPPPAPINSNWQQQAIAKQQQQQLTSQNINGQQQSTLPEVPASFVGQNEAVHQHPQQQQQQRQQPQIMKTLQQQQTQSAQNLVPSLNQQQLHQVQQPSQIQSFQASGPAVAKSPEDSDEYEESEEKSTEPPKKHKHKKVKSKSKDLQNSNQENLDDTKAAQKSIKTIKSAISPVHEQYEIIHQNMALEFRDHDGQSERPGGAVLSLTLGLLITAALAILIGCRMRTVGRRVRRMGSKSPYSHEADFLVNGMYL